MQAKQTPLILTLKVDEKSQSYFNHLRNLYFPPEINFLQAHCILFHQLPDSPETFRIFNEQNLAVIQIQVTGLMNLGAGDAYRLSAPGLSGLHHRLSRQFEQHLIPQDRQGYRPHITIQNKVTPLAATNLLKQLANSFSPFTVTGTALQLWRYQGGPWLLLAENKFTTVS